MHGYPQAKTTTSTLQTPDGLSLFTKTWHSSRPLCARLVFLHGFSDHCDFYDPLFDILAAHGITTYSFDQRGWGRSVHTKAQRGLSGGTVQILNDITHFIRHLPREDAGAPLFLAGHSMGGGEVLFYAARGPAEVVKEIRGFLLESPFCGLPPANRPPWLKVVLGRWLGKLLPGRQMVVELDAMGVSRDDEIRERWKKDTLNHDTGTLEGLTALFDRAVDLESGRVTVPEGRGEGDKTRLWVGHGTEDTLAWIESAKSMFAHHAHIQDKEFQTYEGWAHKLHMEPGEDKKTFAEDMARWILARSEAIIPKARL